jgi:metal-responsive CopG/Arc/MetJ family transcriptional regulator
MATDPKKTVTISLPQEELAEFDRVSERQHLSRDDALREALRWYVEAMRRLPPAEEATTDEIKAIEQGRGEFARGETISLEDLQRELGLPTR